ncbi:MAG: hypothetical protein M5R38_05535 [Candidatus Methylomirabilis sp.]|nr:hypothetical protein [Candidatus Methylomirabilis sp.]
MHDDLLPDRFAVIGFAETGEGPSGLSRRDGQGGGAVCPPASGETGGGDRLARGLYYVAAAFEEPAGYERLRTLLADVDHRHGTGGYRLYYLATPPRPMRRLWRAWGRRTGERDGGGAVRHDPCPEDSRLLPDYRRKAVRA